MATVAPAARGLLLVVWLCFLARGVFYSVLSPMWEGYDEWVHVSYVQRLAYTGKLPIPGQTRVSREVQESLHLAPLPWAAFELPGPHRTHDEYWKLPAGEREGMRLKLTALPRQWAREEATRNLLLYQAQHPPLYYWVLAPVQLAAEKASLPSRVLLMRLASLLLTSLTIPLGFAVARLVFTSEGLAVAAAALVAAMPGFVMTAARVGNDGLAAVIFTALLWTVLSADRLRGGKRALLPGLLLGVGLITKAYFLTAIPALAVVCAWRLWRSRGKRGQVVLDTTGTFAAAATISGWWYWRNWVLTGSWSGLQQVVGLRELSLLDVLRQVRQVDWGRWLDSTFLSYLWFGNWSFLQLRSWMYHFFWCISLAAILGLSLLIWRGKTSFDASPRRHVLILGSFCGFFCAGLAYHQIIFSLQGLSSGAGWYLYALVVAEALLVALGLMALCPPRWREWVLPAGTACFALLDVYATHFVLIPYYTGLISHRENGMLASFHLSQLDSGGFQAMVTRLSGGMFSVPAVVVLWLCFMTATFALPLIAIHGARSKLS